MKTARLISITVIVDRQTVEIPRQELKIVDGGFEYDDLFIPVSAQQIIVADGLSNAPDEPLSEETYKIGAFNAVERRR